MKEVLINLISFKAAWAVCIFAAAASMPLVSAIAVAVAVTLHLVRTRNVNAESTLLAIAALVGFAWESLLVAAGVLEYNAGMVLPGLAPYWIVAMWVLFATTLNVGMRWLRNNVVVAIAAGAIGGPMAFYAGAAAGAVSLNDPLLAMLAIGAGWAVLLPMLTSVAKQFDGHAPVAAASGAETQGQAS